MIRSFIINKYLSKQFIKIVFNISIIFFCLGFIMNIFEEINFFKDFDVSITTPILLSLLFVPSLLNNFFPFVILLSGIWFIISLPLPWLITTPDVAYPQLVVILQMTALISVPFVALAVAWTLKPELTTNS